MTAEQAIEKNDPVLGYNVSKKRAELAAWKFMEEQKPAYDLTIISPDIITGPMIHYIDGKKSINETNHFAIASFIDGTHKDIEGVTFPFYYFVSVVQACHKIILIGSITGRCTRCSIGSCGLFDQQSCI